MKVPTSYNPDVLTCLANLSNDEVFTPPSLVNQMLDTLPAELWKDKQAKFLDPASKSGVFLREIARRLVEGLEDEIPDLQERIDHIYQNQLYGIAITELTALLARRSLYCSKAANSKYAIGRVFKSEQGNVLFKRIEHSWKDGKCLYCNVNQAAYDRGELLETHAYEFIHTDEPSKIFNNMKWDVIVGNPPYQLGSDGGTRDIPIYNKFVDQAKKLNPRFLSMIIPSRWMASGLGLSEFRRSMLEDRRIRKLVDHPVASEVFPGVEVKGGVCYFLWDRDYEGDCAVTSVRGQDVFGPVVRSLKDYDVFVRDSRALGILDKVLRKQEKSITEILSVDKEFGWTSNFDGFHTRQKLGDVCLHYIRQGKRGVGWISRKDIDKSRELIDTWKVLIPQAGSDGGKRIPDPVLGKPLIATSPSVCTQSYLFFHVKSAEEAESVESYVRTKFLRFLVSLRKITQHATRSTYTWVPQQEWNHAWTDKELYKKYGLSKEEEAYIESVIKPL